MPSPLTIAKITLRQEVVDRVGDVDAQYDLAVLALQGEDLAAAAAHMANLARAARQCAGVLTALHENQQTVSA